MIALPFQPVVAGARRLTPRTLSMRYAKVSIPILLTALASLVMPSAALADCIKYRLSSFGGEGGFRVTSNPNNFHRVSNGSVHGKLCQRGQAQVELSKRDPGTRVNLEIGGRTYTFDQGSRGDKQVNNWYRVYFNVDLGG